METIQQLLTAIEKSITAVFKKIDLDNSDLAKNIKITFVNDKVTMYAPSYIEFVDKGRRPSKKLPPIKDIEKWIKDKKINVPQGQTIKNIAFAIAKSIAENGYKGKHFLTLLEQEIGDLIKVFIQNKMNDELDKLSSNKTI